MIWYVTCICTSEVFSTSNVKDGLPRWISGKESTCQWKRLRFNPWVRKIPWRRKWQPTPVLLPEKSRGQMSLVGLKSSGSRRVRRDSATKQQQQQCERFRSPVTSHLKYAAPVIQRIKYFYELLSQTWLWWLVLCLLAWPWGTEIIPRSFLGMSGREFWETLALESMDPVKQILSLMWVQNHPIHSWLG